jgi:hypothetical protein
MSGLRLLAGAGLLALAAALVTGPSRAADEFKAEDGYTSLFNGKDLTGWMYKPMPKESLEGKTSTPDGRIEVKDGAIVMNEKDKDGKGGIKDLFTIKEYNKGFNLRMEFRASNKADSGVYLRASGAQMQIRDFIRRGEHKELKNFKNDDWNQLDITVRDGVVTTTVNGKAVTAKDVLELTVRDGKPTAKLNGKDIDVNAVAVKVGSVATATLNGEPLNEGAGNIPAKGGVGLQAETGKFEYRHIRIKELD